MAFAIKPFAQIVEDMILHMRGTTDKVTDYNVGSVARTLLEAPALEIDEFYQTLYYSLLEAIPTAIYRGFGFELLPAIAAGGWVEFRLDVARDAAIVIPAGTLLEGPTGVRYQTLESVTLDAGSLSVRVRVAATEAGALGNANPDTLMLISNMDDSLSTANGLIAGGADAETEDGRAQRFAAFIASLSRGTIVALQYAAKIPVVTNDSGLAVERVERVSVQEEPGHVFVHIYNGHSGIASDALIASVQQIIDGYRDQDTLEWIAGYRPAGMRVDVRAMIAVPVSVSIEIDCAPALRTDATASAVRGEISRVIMATRPSSELRPIQIINAALAVPGVDGAIVLTPTAPVPAGIDRALEPAEVTVTWTA